jgi:hypothetical protein
VILLPQPLEYWDFSCVAPHNGVGHAVSLDPVFLLIPFRGDLATLQCHELPLIFTQLLFSAL